MEWADLLEGVDVAGGVVHGVVGLQQEVDIAQVQRHIEQGEHQQVVEPLQLWGPHAV